MRDFPLRLQHSSGEIMSLERDRVLVGFASPEAAAEADRVLSDLGLMAEEEIEPYRPDATGSVRFTRPLNRTDTRVWARTVDGTAFRAGSFEVPERIIEWVAPVYRLEVQGPLEPFAVLPHVLLIDFDTREGADRVSGLLDRYGLEEDPALSEYQGEYGYYRLQRPLEESSIEVRSRLFEQDHELVRYVEFETMPMFVPLAYVPNDPDYANQWNTRQIRAGGVGRTAWNISRGEPSVVICVLDSGCDLGHPDLNFVSNGIRLDTMKPPGSPIPHPNVPNVEGHGTACAGIAAAAIDNAIGVAGVAGGCQILPVAFRTWSNAEVARGIRYAAQNGARVINMSFYHYVQPSLDFERGFRQRVDLNLAIQYAFDRNVVMCACTGNDNTIIGYPARHPLVIACGASGPDDNRISPTSPQNWLPDHQGSNFGPEISVVAPGINIPTTDVQGSAGFDSGDYSMGFGGTSAATPHVAGLAALLISVNDALGNVEVQEIIERTADKVGAVPYALTPGYWNGTWNQEMGYGRINAYEAVRLASNPWFRGRRFVSKVVQPDKNRVFDTKSASKSEFENPFDFETGVLEHILERLERLERRTGVGRPFIPRSERPDVGRNIARRADENE